MNFSNTGCPIDYTVCQQMTVLVPASMLTTAGTPDIVVTNPAPGGGTFDDVDVESQRFTVLASCSYTVTPNTPQNITSSAQTLSFSVTPTPTGCTWNSSSSASWMTGQNPGDFYYSDSANFFVQANGPTARTGNLTIAGQTVTVSQAGGLCSLTLNAISESYTASGGSGQFAIFEKPTTCASWTASSDSSWLTITSTAAADSMNDDGVVTYSVAPDSAMGVRTGHINVPGAGAFTVVQLGIPSACDVNQDGKTNVRDVQLTIDEALGANPAANDLNEDHKVNAVDVQIVTNAVLGLGCSAS
jgi:hypothetical protein